MPFSDVSNDNSDGATGTNGTVENWDSFETACITKGTLIETSKGDRAVEQIKKGDRVMTANGIYQSVRWIGSTKVNADTLSQNQKLRPIRIVAGALGHGLPKNDLLVSRQHRMLVSSEIAHRLCGAIDVLIPAIGLTELPGIFECQDTSDAEYFHILFDDHEVIFAEGAPTESLFTGPETLKSVPAPARKEILELFPELSNLDYETTPAALIPEGKRQKQVIARHAKVGKFALDGLYQ